MARMAQSAGSIPALAARQSLMEGERMRCSGGVLGLIARLTRKPDIDLVLGDITGVPVDAVVNPARAGLLSGDGVSAAIYRVGGFAVLRACQQLREELPEGLPPGFALITTGGGLPARWVIHTVVPARGPSGARVAVLRSCYAKSLAAADAVGARSVAFPLLGAGEGWSLDEAAGEALAVLRAARTRVRTVVLVVPDVLAYSVVSGRLRPSF